MQDKKKIHEFREQFWKMVEDSNSILITSHKNPDDDSISSVLSMYYIIKEQYPDKSVRIMYGSPKEERWNYFENFDKVEFVESIDKELEAFDLLIVVDVNTYVRAGINSIQNFKGKTVCIDHHVSVPDEFNLSFIEESASNGGPTSNAENIYNIFIKEKETFSKRLAEIILLGIVGDTGSFIFIRPDQSENFAVIKRLVEVGDIDIQTFIGRIRTFSFKTFAVMQEFVSNTRIISVEGWPDFMFSYIAKEFISKNNFSDQEVHSGSDIFVGKFTTSFKDAPWGISMYPTKEGTIKTSWRSRPEGVNVRVIAESVAKGGGHNLASGCVFNKEGGDLTPEEALEKVIEWLKVNRPTKLN